MSDALDTVAGRSDLMASRQWHHRYRDEHELPHLAALVHMSCTVTAGYMQDGLPRAADQACASPWILCEVFSQVAS